jgi:hypothetical protein
MCATNVKYELRGEDYLKLWMYSQDRADKIKEAMFKTVTWTVGFTSALLGFIFLTFVNFDKEKATISRPWIIIIAGAAGLLTCLYSLFAIAESKRHIVSNWDAANHYANFLKDFDPDRTRGPGRFTKVWHELSVIVWVFGLAFTALVIYGVYSLGEVKTVGRGAFTIARF